MNDGQENARGSGVPLEQLLDVDADSWQLRAAERNREAAERNARIAQENRRNARRNLIFAWVTFPATVLLCWGSAGWNLWVGHQWRRDHPAVTVTTTHGESKILKRTLDCPAGFTVASAFEKLNGTPENPVQPADIDEAIRLAQCRHLTAWEQHAYPMPAGEVHRVTIQTVDKEKPQ